MCSIEERKMRAIAEALSETLPNHGFALVMYPKDQQKTKGQASYISNVAPQQMIDSFKEIIEILKRTQDNNAPSNN